MFAAHVPHAALFSLYIIFLARKHSQIPYVCYHVDLHSTNRAYSPELALVTSWSGSGPPAHSSSADIHLAPTTPQVYLIPAGPLGIGCIGSRQCASHLYPAGALCTAAAMWAASVSLCLGPLLGGRCVAVSAQGSSHFGVVPMRLSSQLQAVSLSMPSSSCANVLHISLWPQIVFKDGLHEHLLHVLRISWNLRWQSCGYAPLCAFMASQ